jgi:hypothetical protein
MEHTEQPSKHATSRRSFLRKGLVVGGAGTIGAGLLAAGVPAFAEERSGGLTKGYSVSRWWIIRTFLPLA